MYILFVVDIARRWQRFSEWWWFIPDSNCVTAHAPKTPPVANAPEPQRDSNRLQTIDKRQVLSQLAQENSNIMASVDDIFKVF